MRTLVYLGAHLGGSLQGLVSQYDKIIAIEANPKFCEYLKNKFSSNPKVLIVNAAVGEVHGGVRTFHISKNNGDSSSLLIPNKDNCLHDMISSDFSVDVPAINLQTFLREMGVDHITTYISDLQGYDFIVLSTLKEMLDSKSIETIQCEVGLPEKPPIYVNTDPTTRNIEENFNNILSKNYEKVATGWGTLIDGVFQLVPSEWAEWDIKWRAKTS